MLENGEYIEVDHGLIVVCSRVTIQYDKSVSSLKEEVYKRTGVALKRIEADNDDHTSPVVVTALAEDLEKVEKIYGRLDFYKERLTDEGYYLYVSSVGRTVIYIIGADYRGILFGIGKLLRSISWEKDSFKIKAGLKIISGPALAVRGHQLGYRPKTNAYDAWDERQYEQYIRELAFFGANAIELIPPRSDDELLSRHMKTEPLEMLVKTAETIDSYGLDVWIWYPNVGADYKSETGIKKELDEREEIFSKLSKINALSIPGGDPGELDSDLFFEWTGKVAKVLNKYHPEAKIWVSPQNFLLTGEWVEYFYKKINQKPDWLGGVVFGPWERDSVEDLRKQVSSDIPIRNYPDITHSYFAQYAVPDWDPAFAATLGRECINPRPAAMKLIHNRTAGYTIGGITYSEGINDDVNKFVWAGQDWDPGTSAYDTVREYASLFISSRFADDIAQAVMLLEENWNGPILANPGISRTYLAWKNIENELKDESKDNYRLKLCLLRAYYDAFIKRRLIYETEMEQQALDILEKHPDCDSTEEINTALAVIEKIESNPVGKELCEKCLALANELFELIGAQFSVARHGAIRWQRGAFMDDILEPLCDYPWIKKQLTQALATKDAMERRELIQNIFEIKYGLGKGYYDNLGTFGGMKRVANKRKWEDDPGFRASPLAGFATPLLHREVEGIATGPVPLSWVSSITAYTGVPVVLKYENLGTDSAYSLKITYVGYQYGQRRSVLKLIANSNYLVHDDIDIKGKCMRKEYILPAEVVKNGVLELVWVSPDGYQGPSIAEVWLEKKDR